MTGKIGTFKHQFTFECGRGNSFWLGLGLNSSSGPPANRVRLEFNPNKVGWDYQFRKVFNRVRACSVGSPLVVRFDLAVDIPVLRRNCYLLKDNRIYEEYRNSWDDRTQYVGARNKSGRCKLYNKQIESKLSHPLSRFKITLSGEDIPYHKAVELMPKVLILDDLQLCFSGEKLSDTDAFILRTVLDSPDRLTELHRYKKKKIACILDKYTRSLTLDNACYNEIIASLAVFSQVLENESCFNPFTGYREVVSGEFSRDDRAQIGFDS